MEFFKSDDTNNESLVETKRDIGFQTVVAMRDTLSLALGKTQPPTYEQSLRIIHDIDPTLYENLDQLLAEKNDSDIVKFYKESAKLQSIQKGEKVEALFLIEAEIQNLEDLLQTSQQEDTIYVSRRIAQLYKARENLQPRHLTENAILTRDFSQVDRSNIFGRPIESTYKHIDYILSKDSLLRIRLLHPDIEEQITGADLIYEQYNVLTKQVRFVFLQYKTWDNNGVIYFSQHENLKPQLNKLQTALCNRKFCEAPNIANDYRLPHCSGFLRPTDKLQHKNSKMVSSGLHIPVCHALKLANNVKLEKKQLKSSTLNHYIFEKLFNINYVGSRWINIDEVEKFYKETKILSSTDRLTFYVSEAKQTEFADIEEEYDE